LKSLTNSKIISLKELDNFSKEILNFLEKDSIVLLNGTLAAGKTTLVKAIVKSMGIEDIAVTSPTFSLQQSYGDRVFHYDFYRVDFLDLVNLGIVEEFEKSGLHFVEWANEELLDLLKSADFKIYSITINVPSSSVREYNLEVINA